MISGKLPRLARSCGLALLLAACGKQAQAPVDAGSAADASAHEEPSAAGVEPTTDSELKWVAVSQDSKAVVSHSALPSGQCTVTCAVGDEVRWSTSSCLAKKLDLRFVSNDCEKLLAMHQLPELDKNLAATALIHVFRKGAPEYVVTLGGLRRTPKTVKRTGTSLYWIAGALEQPGEPPRYSEDGGAVEFHTLDGKRHSVSLLASARPQKPEPKRPKGGAQKKKRRP